MGTWGHRSFENDGALDWVAELEVDGVDAIRDALTAITDSGGGEYIDVDDACFAVAAAEVVAAARGHGPEGLPDEIVDWLDDSASSVTVPDAVLARKAVARVRENSELQELWGENGSENDWDREMASLLARLAAAAAA